jgi:hypothetical protein
VTSEALLVVVFDALAALEIPFVVSGSLASNFYGVPRATQDADSQIAFETVTGSRRLLAQARQSAFRVELFDLTDDPHDRERFARRRLVDILERTVTVPTPEDVIITKLRWAKLAGRRKDVEDARNVVAIQRAALDREYLDRWCRELGLVESLQAIEQSLE